MYEYQCTACRSRFERLSWGEGAAPVHCSCGSGAVERIWYSRTAIGAADGGTDFSDSGDCARPQGCCGGGACGMDVN